ncbi:MAG: hypothetical protein ACRDT6_16840 [Micromonosporaceae bacterium]
MANRHRTELQAEHLRARLDALDGELIELWHIRAKVAASLHEPELTGARLSADRAAARRYAGELGRRIGTALADLLRTEARCTHYGGN